MEKIVIIGGKGTAVVIAEQIFDAHKRYGVDVEMLGFAFDDLSFGTEINGFPILCKTTEAREKFSSYNDVKFIFSLYRFDLIKQRTELLNSYSIPLNKFTNFIHPSAYIAKSVKMGNGNVILANAVVNPNVQMGNHNTFNSSCLIGHDTVMGNNNFFAGHACIGSNIKIQNESFFGLNCSVKNFAIVESNCVVGMHSNVTSNISQGTTVIGNPAKPIFK